MLRLETLAEVFAQVKDSRKAKGKRHPLAGMLSLVFLGLLARIREMAVLQRWAEMHWDQLKEPLGFDRDSPPHATTISRAIAGCRVEDFEQAYLIWLKNHLPDEPFIAAVDAKTSCQGIDTDGEPVQLVTVLIHELKLVIAQWSVRGEKTNEAGVLKNHLAELRQQFPLLASLTGDAIYANRPLAEATLAENVDYLVQIKDNQKEVREAVEHCLGDAHERPPAAKTAEKKGDRIDRRQLWLDLENAEYIREQLAYPGCQIALRVDRDVIDEAGVVHLSETRYFITSTLPEQVTADQLLTNVRQHWHVENCAFFLKDRWWDEDRHWTRRPGLSEWLARLTTAATTVLRIFRNTRIPLRGFADFNQWDPRLGLRILGLQ